MQSDTYRDVAYAIRILRKHPFSSFAVVLTLAIAIGANTAVFSIVNFLIFRPLPIKEPSQIYVLAFRQNQALGSQTSIPNFLDIQRSSRDVFQYLIGYKLGIDGLSVDGRADRITTSFVTGDYFVALGIKPELGRFVLPSEGTISGADPIVVLSYSYWRTRFRGDPQVIGQRVLVNGHPFTIVGVGPKGFHGLHPLLDTQAFLPLAMATIEGQSPDFMNNRVTRSLTVIGRLESGVTARKAQSELDAISSRLAGQFPESDATLEILSYPEASARPEPSSSRGLAIVSILFLTLTASVLVLACVNIASLVVIQMNARRFEFAVRTSFGASRSRLIRQIFTEILLLSLIGGSVGVVLGTGICRFLGRINLRTDVLFTIDFSLDWRVFAFSLAMTMLMAMLVGLLPALRIPAGDLSQILHDGNLTAPPSRQRIRKVLVVFQIASALSLLIIGALLARSLYHAQRMKLGFDPRGLLNISMDSNEVGHASSTANF
jgi:putative ABC transport system permease protein